jgi:tyrosyl-tRNA synthetase
MKLKQRLAFLVTERVHGVEGAEQGAEHFARVVQRKEEPDEIQRVAVRLAGESDLGLLDGLRALGFAASGGEGRRLVKQGAVSIDGERASDPLVRLSPGVYRIKVGKRRFADLQVSM